MDSLPPQRPHGFTVLEVILALGIFSIAAVALAGALNTISLSVVESVDQAKWREQMRSHLIRAARDPALEVGTDESLIGSTGVYYRTTIALLETKNEDGRSLKDLYSVEVVAIQRLPTGREEVLARASTYAWPGLFQAVSPGTPP